MKINNQRPLTEFEKNWKDLLLKMKPHFDKAPNMDALLLLIGIQESGKIKRKYSKEQKQDLMHVAICNLLSKDGYYQYEGRDDEGWPHYKPVKKITDDARQQEILLKERIIEYFRK